MTTARLAIALSKGTRRKSRPKKPAWPATAAELVALSEIMPAEPFADFVWRWREEEHATRDRARRLRRVAA